MNACQDKSNFQSSHRRTPKTPPLQKAQGWGTRKFKGWRTRRRRSVDIKELGEETFIAHSVETPYRSRVIQLFEKHRTTLRRDIETPTIESIKRFVQMGMGVAIVPKMCLRWEVERKLLAEVRIRHLKMPRSLYLVSRRGARLSHAAVGLMKLLQA
jgi:DNA-binding transcriptional LysR family regulator